MDDLITVAIVYDFDGTLAPGNMQEFEFIPSVGMKIGDFWEEADHIATTNDADSVLSYMATMISAARRSGHPITAPMLRTMGSHIRLFEGVEEWFERINRYGESQGVRIKHYVNSSGIREMIEGSSIADRFHKIYASSFLYNPNGEAYWPGVAINYTNKTQFIFKINKGIESVSDSTRVNEYTPHDQRPIPFRHIIFVGDGSTDIPSMSLVNSLGGHAIAVYDPTRESKREEMMQLIREGRAGYVCPASYTATSAINSIVEGIINKVAADAELERLRSASTLG